MNENQGNPDTPKSVAAISQTIAAKKPLKKSAAKKAEVKKAAKKRKPKRVIKKKAIVRKVVKKEELNSVPIQTKVTESIKEDVITLCSLKGIRESEYLRELLVKTHKKEKVKKK